MHRAVSISLMGNGDIITKVLKTEFQVIMSQERESPAGPGASPFKIVEGKQSYVYFRSKSIVMAGGA
jgi:hypothetical protein